MGVERSLPLGWGAVLIADCDLDDELRASRTGSGRDGEAEPEAGGVDERSEACDVGVADVEGAKAGGGAGVDAAEALVGGFHVVGG
jgi:hypothetical protein